MHKTIKKITQRLRPGTILAKNVVKNVKQPQIIALGGGGFSDDTGNPLLDEYILNQSGKAKPKILFLPTAGGDHEDYIEKFYKAYKNLNCKPTHISLTRKKYSFERLQSVVLEQDVIFVGGGSPRFLMQAWRKTGMDKIIRKAYTQGIVLSGMSAGAICWFDDGFKNPREDVWMRISCMGFLEGSLCPHYDKRGELRQAYRRMVSEAEISSGYGVQDGVALHFIGKELKHIVSSHPDAKAFYVKKTGIRVTEKEITPVFLGSKLFDVLQNNHRPDESDSGKIIEMYVERINNHDVDGMVKMVSDDSVFIDSMGINTHGRENMRKAWDVLLTFFPDYHVKIKNVITKNGMVALFGTACGTLATDGKILSENQFEIPASWTAEVKEGKITKWRVYADNEPVRKLIEKYGGK